MLTNYLPAVYDDIVGPLELDSDIWVDELLQLVPNNAAHTQWDQRHGYAHVRHLECHGDVEVALGRRPGATPGASPRRLGVCDDRKTSRSRSVGGIDNLLSLFVMT
jgi:hypothetical protein